MADFIWHETIQTQHTRRSYRAEVSNDVVTMIQGWLVADEFDLPGGYRCRITQRSREGLQAEVHGATGLLVRINITRESEPLCEVSVEPGLVADLDAADWLGDFERCLA